MLLKAQAASSRVPGPPKRLSGSTTLAFHSGSLSSVRVWDLPLCALASGRGHLGQLLFLP